MKKINAFEYNTLIWFLIRATFIEITSEILLSIAHQDAWISILIALFIGTIPLFIYNHLKNKYPNLTIIGINKKLLGKFGTFLNLIIIGGIFIFTVVSFWILLNFIDSQYLYKTNIIMIIFILLIPIVYAAIQNIHVLGKVSLIMFYIALIFIIIILAGLWNNVDINNLKPILNNSSSSILYGTFCFIGFNTLPIFMLSIIPKNQINGYKPKNTFLFYCLGVLSLLNVLFLTISIFGINLAELYNYPSFHLLKRVSLLDLIDRVESILSLEWFLALFIQIVIGLYFIKNSLSEIFQTKQKTNNIIITIVCFIIAILSIFIFNTKGSEISYFKNQLIYILYTVCFLIPLITFFKSLKKT